MIKCTKAILSIWLAICPALFFSQERQMTAREVADMAIVNHQQLKVAAQNIDIAKQNVEIAKEHKLPSIKASTSQFYLGNAFVLEKDLTDFQNVTMPHYGSTYGIEASELIFKGGLVKKNIELAGLREQLVLLDFDKNKQDIKLLVISNYLDVYKIINQKIVYENNKKLALERLKNIQKFYQQGMLTRNEVIRAELAIKNLDQGILTLSNNRKILNYNLDIALGLSDEIQIVPIEDLSSKEAGLGLEYYKNLAYENNPQLKSAKTNIDVADKNIEIIKTDKMPTLAAFGGYSVQRPFTNVMPAMDIYLNVWQTGVQLSYNIDSLFKSKGKIELGEMQKHQAQDALTLVKQNIDMSVNAAYIKYEESIQQVDILDEAKKLAEENYKITEAKYLNQLAVQTEMIDAQNQKLQSELDYTNGEINVLYQYYNLLKTTGSL